MIYWTGISWLWLKFKYWQNMFLRSFWDCNHPHPNDPRGSSTHVNSSSSVLSLLFRLLTFIVRDYHDLLVSSMKVHSVLSRNTNILSKGLSSIPLLLSFIFLILLPVWLDVPSYIKRISIGMDTYFVLKIRVRSHWNRRTSSYFKNTLWWTEFSSEF